MKKNLVSIVIPVYNAENYLEKLFKDILEQTYSSLEIIIIDDGSEDNSWEIIQKYADQDDRIRSVRTSNKGPSSARNTGLDMVQGEYIRFIDADDEITKDSIELMVGFLKKNDYTDLVIGNYQCMPEHNYFKGDEFSDIILCQNDFAKYFVRNMKSFYYGVTWNKLYRTEIVKKYNIRFNEQIDWCEDLCFNIDYYEKCQNIHLFSIEGGIYTYCSRESSVTNCLSLRRKEELLNIDDICYQKAAKYFKTFGLEKLMQLEWKYSNLY